MAVYHLCDIMDRIMEIINDGMFFADITEFSGDDESLSSLSFYALDSNEGCEIDYEEVESIAEDTPCTIEDKICYGLTLKELATVHHALTNALEFFKNCSSDGTYDRETLDDIKTSSIECRNLQTKIGKFIDSLM